MATALPVVDLDTELDTGPDAFIDTAAVIVGALDLVFTSDTSIAHLAAALGTPVWAVLPRPCDWALGEHGDRSVFVPPTASSGNASPWTVVRRPRPGHTRASCRRWDDSTHTKHGRCLSYLTRAP